jgi:uncharacterized protein YwqG
MVGESKIGGMPDITQNFEWPQWKRQPLAFICQVNLSELDKMECAKMLPREGMLYFFYDADGQPWGYDPKDRGAWRVAYYKGSLKALRRRTPPETLSDNSRFQSCKVEKNEILTLPAVNSGKITNVNVDLEQSERDAYYDFFEVCHEQETSSSKHQLLGHPDQLQGDMQLQSQLVSHGLYCGNASGYQNPQAKVFANHASEWQLLLQIDSDDNSGMMWGDSGHIYYWIKKSDLQRKVFDNMWVILQCG